MTKPSETVTLHDEGESAPRAPATQLAEREPQEIDRYRIVGRLGAGGMGVVYEAHDPQLDRRIALKLVRATATAAQPLAQANLVREAQAMAKLQHPNVVAVYDVGLFEGRVFVAMELVAGMTLRDWIAAEPRSWRAIVSAFVGASRGLAAAHAAGLVHRDFKPDNVLIATSDGTARLTDFGLARPVDDAERPEAGTLAYMAPEQHDGAPITEAADQFAFATALWEAVFGARPFAGDTIAELAEAKREHAIAEPPRGRARPGWLVAALRRALSSDPGDRFPSLAALGRALERGLARRRRAIVASAAVAIAAGTFVGGLQASSGPERCGGAAGDLAATWNDAARDTMIAHLRTLGPYAMQEATRLAGDLGDYGKRWAETREAACKASGRGELTAQLYERNLACLERSRSALGAAIDVVTRVPEERLSDAITAARSLPDPTACRARTLGTAVTPPAPAVAPLANGIANNLERIRVLAQAGEPDAATQAEVQVSQARRLGYLPLIARGELVQALAAFVHFDMPRAYPLLDDAARTALAAGDDVLFVEAYARQIFAVSVMQGRLLPADAPESFGAIRYAEQIATRLGDAAAFERPLLLNNIGVHHKLDNRPAEARRYFQRALDEPQTQAGDPELSGIYGNMALVATSPQERARYFAIQQTMIERLLGADHMHSIDIALRSAYFVADASAAAAAIRVPCERMRALHRSATAHIDECMFQLGSLAVELGDTAAARPYLGQISHDPTGRDDDLYIIAHAYLDLFDGQLERAAGVATTLRDRLAGEPWVRMHAADAFLAAARADAQRGRKAAAIATLQAALAALQDAPAEPLYDRRVARLRAELARLRGASP